ncbi:hypothetical protein FRB97_008530 [Tulasnella sp. 331]|nr:hypothetical protein FRB97_008530 [Tulasnella sp. 331]KAG8888292.1 hypothetical protein FRB98_008038 [Tulasnella sp. 332]
MPEFSALVIQHVRRWKNFDAFGTNSDEAEGLLDSIAESLVPKLQELSLVDTGFTQSTKGPFGGQTCQLRRIKLRSNIVPWNSATLSNLLVLDVSDFIWHGPSTNQVDVILRASPALVELTLQEFS